VSSELLLLQVELKVLCEDVISFGLVAYVLRLVVAVEEGKVVLSLFFAVFPLGSWTSSFVVNCFTVSLSQILLHHDITAVRGVVSLCDR
jgi:hypothetical protein